MFKMDHYRTVPRAIRWGAVIGLAAATLAVPSSAGAWSGACPEQDGTIWYLDYGGPNNSAVTYNLEQRNPAGDPTGITDTVVLGDGVSYWWYSPAFALAVEYPSGAGWTLDVGYNIGASSLEDSTLELRVYAVPNYGSKSGNLLASWTTGLLKGSPNWDVKFGEWTLTGQASQSVPAGWRLALEIKNVDPTLASTATIHYESSSVCSHLVAPIPLPPDADGDGYRADVDCNDGDPAVYPGAEEICGNGVDDNCNGQVDESPCPPVPGLPSALLMMGGMLSLGIGLWRIRRRAVAAS